MFPVITVQGARERMEQERKERAESRATAAEVYKKMFAIFQGCHYMVTTATTMDDDGHEYKHSPPFSKASKKDGANWKSSQSLVNHTNKLSH